jgi:hypothetical protein
VSSTRATGLACLGGLGRGNGEGPLENDLEGVLSNLLNLDVSVDACSSYNDAKQQTISRFGGL